MGPGLIFRELSFFHYSLLTRPEVFDGHHAAAAAAAFGSYHYADHGLFVVSY